MNYRPYAPPVETSALANLSFVRRVYSLLAAGIATAIGGAMFALYAGTPITLAAADDGTRVAVSPLVALTVQHWIIATLIYFGAFFAASRMRRVPGVNVAGLFGFTFVSGLYVAPSIFFAMLMASQGQTLDPSPVRDAFLLTGMAFTGLTSYAFITKKDFSFLGAALSTGLWVVIGAMVLAWLLGSSVLSLAAASVGVLLFAGYILYDTSIILRSDDRGDAVGAALRLFLDVINLFLSLLRILAAARRR